MEKEQAAEYLKGLGINAEVVDGVVVIWVKKPIWKGKKEQIRNYLRSVGYKGSWGWRVGG